MLTRLHRRGRSDAGASLLIAIVFIGAVGLWVTAIIQLAFPNLATTGVVRGNRGTNYDVDAAMAQDISTIRFTNLGTSSAPKLSGIPGSGNCPQLSYTNGSDPALIVQCNAQTQPGPYQRYVQLQVCFATDSSCTSPLATADVYYFDDGDWGRAAYVSDWSTR